MGLTGSRTRRSITAPMNEEAAEVGTRVVLITGCSTGIGLSTAVILAEDVKRFKVYATMRNLEKKSELENAAGKHLGESLIIKALDVRNEEEVNRLVKEIEREEGRIDCVTVLRFIQWMQEPITRSFHYLL